MIYHVMALLLSDSTSSSWSTMGAVIRINIQKRKRENLDRNCLKEFFYRDVQTQIQGSSGLGLMEEHVNRCKDCRNTTYMAYTARRQDDNDKMEARERPATTWPSLSRIPAGFQGEALNPKMGREVVVNMSVNRTRTRHWELFPCSE